ncbi:MAG: sulfite exporter TauE/SafE family protein, partial [candidate division FCPU426 bacterium]
HAHAVWKHLWRLFPWTLAGVVLGWFCMGKLDEAQTRHLIGLIVLVLVLFQLLQRWKKDLFPPMHGMVYVALMGLSAGFTTLVANAAGPIMLLYLLATGLPKMEFMGTGAVYFLILNCAKVPFIYSLGLIDFSSLSIDLALAPAAAAGALFGKRLLPHINQKAFEALALAATIAAAAKLLLW